MPPLKTITRFFIIFIISFVSLVFLFSIKQVRQAHNIYYCTFADHVLNVVNPHVYTEFLPEAKENTNNWTTTFKVWDQRRHKQSLWLKSYREKVPARAILYQNLHELVLVPSLFILALFISSPIRWKTKLYRGAIAMLIFYIFMALYFSYRFEFTLNGQTLPIDSIWHAIIWFCGLGGAIDPIYVVAGLTWGVLVVPIVLKKYSKTIS